MSLAVGDTRDLGRSSARRVQVPALAPHLALGLAVVVMVLANGSSLLRDPDTQWHIAVGRWIVAHGSVPRTDLFSHTFAGAPWIAKEWVSQLILYVAFDAAGWRGEVVLAALVLAVTFTGLYAWLARQMRVMAALILVSAAFALIEANMLARPHLLVMPVIAAWMIVLVESLDRRTAPPLVAALLIALWANMHGSFPLGLVMAGLLAGEGVFFAPAGFRVVALRRWALFLAVSAAATALSPFGWGAILVPLTIFGNTSALHVITEWQPLGFDAMGAIAAYMIVMTGALLLLDVRRNVFRIVAAGLVAYLMVRHVRFIGLFGLISAILVARTAGTRLPRTSRTLLVDAGTRSVIMVGLAGMAVAAAALAVVLHPEPDAEVAPLRAYEAAMAHGVHGNVFNHYDFGGFLIAHDVKTFVDGRTDQLFLDDFLPDMIKAIDDKDNSNLTRIVAQDRIGWAMIRPHSKTSAHFDTMPGWSRVYEDEHAAVYARD